MDDRPPSRSRNAVLWVPVSLLIVLIVGMLVVLVHPVLLTGRYYDLTIRSVEHGPEGMVTMTYDEALSYGTSVTWMYDVSRGIAANTHFWNRGGRQFPHWPRKERERIFAFYLTSAEERAKGIGDSPEIRQRWVAEKGVYRLRPGDKLVLTRRPWSDGKLFESTIEVMLDP